MTSLFLPILIIIIAICGITFILLWSMSNLSGKTNAAQILQYGREREFFIYEMLRSALPQGTVMRNLYFPVPTKEGVFDTEVDVVCVTTGGIAVIEVKGAKGFIECPPTGVWHQKYKDKNLRFESPYEQNAGHIKAIHRALANKGITNVPVRNLVVFADVNVKFSHKYPWLLRCDQVVDAVDAMNNKMVLSRKDVRIITQVLSAHKKRRHPTFKNKKTHKRSPR